MGKTDKLIERFLSVPNDFTWDELVKLLAYFGYEEIKTGKTGGSRRKFSDQNKNIIAVHKPHPGSIVKTYLIRQVISHLREKEKIS